MAVYKWKRIRIQPKRFHLIGYYILHVAQPLAHNAVLSIPLTGNLQPTQKKTQTFCHSPPLYGSSTVDGRKRRQALDSHSQPTITHPLSCDDYAVSVPSPASRLCRESTIQVSVVCTTLLLVWCVSFTIFLCFI